MKKKDFLIVAAVVLLPFGAFAAEQGQQSTSQETFNQLDANQDGYISEQEAQADPQLAKDWSQADTNQDGKIEASEFSAFEESVQQGGGMPSEQQPGEGQQQQQ
jgi:hypothetical protein